MSQPVNSELMTQARAPWLPRAHSWPHTVLLCALLLAGLCLLGILCMGQGGGKSLPGGCTSRHKVCMEQVHRRVPRGSQGHWKRDTARGGVVWPADRCGARPPSTWHRYRGCSEDSLQVLLSGGEEAPNGDQDPWSGTREEVVGPPGVLGR